MVILLRSLYVKLSTRINGQQFDSYLLGGGVGGIRGVLLRFLSLLGAQSHCVLHLVDDPLGLQIRQGHTTSQHGRHAGPVEQLRGRHCPAEHCSIRHDLSRSPATVGRHQRWHMSTTQACCCCAHLRLTSQPHLSSSVPTACPDTSRSDRSPPGRRRRRLPVQQCCVPGPAARPTACWRARSPRRRVHGRSHSRCLHKPEHAADGVWGLCDESDEGAYVWRPGVSSSRMQMWC